MALSYLLISRGWVSAVFSMSLIGVLLMAPRMMLRPMLCTLSTLALAVFEAYSFMGLIIAKM
jgi:hypothetical protein